jgi:hypothetical protein
MRDILAGDAATPRCMTSSGTEYLVSSGTLLSLTKRCVGVKVPTVQAVTVVFADTVRAVLLISLNTKSILARSSSALLMALSYTNKECLINSTFGCDDEDVKPWEQQDGDATGCRMIR